MKLILIDGAELSHAEIARRLSFPEYYGENLDALHDCLTDISVDTAVIIPHAGAADPRILRVLRLSAGENPHLHVYG